MEEKDPLDYMYVIISISYDMHSFSSKNTTTTSASFICKLNEESWSTAGKGASQTYYNKYFDYGHSKLAFWVPT